MSKLITGIIIGSISFVIGGILLKEVEKRFERIR